MFHKLILAYFGGFILFWGLGIDQFFFAAFCLVGLMSYLLSERTHHNIEVLLFAAFVLASSFSAIQISSAFRSVTYLRNEGVYVAMLFIILSSGFAAARLPKTTDRIYAVLLLFSLQCTVVAFLASNGVSLAFKTPAAFVIPDLGSGYISGMLNKSSVQNEANWFAKGFFRPRGLMLYSNTMAGVLCASMAIKAHFFARFWQDGKRTIAVLCVVAILMDCFSVYSALSRSTWLGFAFALVVFPFAFKTSPRAKLVPVAIGLLTVALVFASGLNTGIEARLTEKGHSNESRGLNYLLIWEYATSSLDTFLIGHGTQIDHPDLGIPLGSHSTYMGVFFKYGIVGFGLFMAFVFAVYRRMLHMTKAAYRLNGLGVRITRPYFLCFSLIVLFVQMTFIEVDVDSSYALFVAVLVYLVVVESRSTDELLEETLAARRPVGHRSGEALTGLVPGSPGRMNEASPHGLIDVT